MAAMMTTHARPDLDADDHRRGFKPRCGKGYGYRRDDDESVFVGLSDPAPIEIYRRKD